MDDKKIERKTPDVSSAVKEPDKKMSAESASKKDADKKPGAQKDSQKKDRPAFRALWAGFSLAFISVICCVIVLKSDSETARIIERNESAAIVKTVNKLLPPDAAKGTSFKCYLIDDPRVGHNMRMYTASRDDEIKGYIMTYSTNRGYSVPLVFIAGFTPDLKVYKADIFISHETPGLGDKVDRNHGAFLDMLNGKGLSDAAWDVKKFGGSFDYITGSTVTSRAVVTATGDALRTLSDLDLAKLKSCHRH